MSTSVGATIETGEFIRLPGRGSIVHRVHAANGDRVTTACGSVFERVGLTVFGSLPPGAKKYECCCCRPEEALAATSTEEPSDE